MLSREEIERRIARYIEEAKKRQREQQPAEPPSTEGILAAIGMGRRYRNPDREKISPVLREHLERWLAGLEANLAEGRGLFIGGPTGVGKTSALAWLLAEVVRRSPRTWVVYAFAPALFDALARGAELAEDAAHCDLLAIDDVGVEYDADWPLARFAILVERRYSEMKPTIVTSNVPPQELAARPGWERIWDRWAETMLGVWVDGPSMRRPAEWSQRGESNGERDAAYA